MQFYVTERGHARPTLEYPAVVLFRDAWDDYGFKTTFHMAYFRDPHHVVEIGAVKILHIEQDGGYTPVPDQGFDQLSIDCCSLGQSLSYYQTLKHLGSDVYEPVLLGLRDVVFSPAVADRFVSHRGFRDSLERFGSSVGAMRDAAPLFSESQPPRPGEATTFRFRTTVGGNSFVLPLAFNSVPDIPGRVNAVIGYNGSGKTRLLANLAMVARAGLTERSDKGFNSVYGELYDPSDIRFSSVIAVSYSAFDTFAVPGVNKQEQEQVVQHGEVFGYVYAGLRSFSKDPTDGDLGEGEAPMRADRLKSIPEINRDFAIALSRVRHPSRRQAVSRAISRVISEPSFLRLGVNLDSLNENAFVDQIFPDLSTGHKTVLNIIVQLGAHLAPRSLVLIDEPESHLHPPLLAALLHGITDLLDEYDSLAVVATHSPVILQEIPRRYVHILRRFGYITEVEQPESETFGENTGFLTRTVFNLDSTATDYHAVLHGLAQRLTIEEIEIRLGNPLSAQARAYVYSVQRSMR